MINAAVRHSCRGLESLNPRTILWRINKVRRVLIGYFFVVVLFSLAFPKAPSVEMYFPNYQINISRNAGLKTTRVGLKMTDPVIGVVLNQHFCRCFFQPCSYRPVCVIRVGTKLDSPRVGLVLNLSERKPRRGVMSPHWGGFTIEIDGSIHYLSAHAIFTFPLVLHSRQN